MAVEIIWNQQNNFLCSKKNPQKTQQYISVAVTLQHQAITWTNVDLTSVRPSDINLRTISQCKLQPSITKINLKITDIKHNSNLPGANNYYPWTIHCTMTKSSEYINLNLVLNGSQSMWPWTTFQMLLLLSTKARGVLSSPIYPSLSIHLTCPSIYLYACPYDLACPIMNSFKPFWNLAGIYFR